MEVSKKLSKQDYQRLHYVVAGELANTLYKTAKFETLNSILQNIDNHEIYKLTACEKKLLVDHLHYLAEEHSGDTYGVQYKTLERLLDNKNDLMKNIQDNCPPGFEYVKAYRKENRTYVKSFCRKIKK